MNKHNHKSNSLTWLFFFISIGSLVAAGIYLEKSLLLGITVWDGIRIFAFAIMGIGLHYAAVFGSPVRR